MFATIEPGVIITGDVHHQRHSSTIQRYLDDSEIELAVDYSNILIRNGLVATILLTGKCFVQAPETCRLLDSKPSIEIGGHTYSAYEPRIIYRIWKYITGSPNGPPFLQKVDTNLTVRVARSAIGKTIRSWRNHAYRNDRHTNKIIVGCGIRTVSNEVGPDVSIRMIDTGAGNLLSMGINVWPDAEHMEHGDVTKVLAGHRKLKYNRFPDVIFNGEEYIEAVDKMVSSLISRGEHAVLLFHPCCMMASDEMRTFEKLCERLSNYPSYTMSEVTMSFI